MRRGSTLNSIEKNEIPVMISVRGEQYFDGVDPDATELGQTLGDALLTPTEIYVKPVLAALDAADIRGISHITGGGFFENIPRSVPDGLCAKIEKAAVRTPAIFRLLQAEGNISEHDLFNTFNMGVGMTIVVSRSTADRALETLRDSGTAAYVLGEIIRGDEKVALC